MSRTSKSKQAATKATAAKPAEVSETAPVEVVVVAPASEEPEADKPTPTEDTPAAVEAPAAVKHVAIKDTAPTFPLSPRALNYVQVLLSQYFGAPETSEKIRKWARAIETGNQVLVRNKPLRIDLTNTPFVRAEVSSDVADDDVLINVHRRLVHVRLATRDD